MRINHQHMPMLRGLVVITLALLAAACIFTPGKFTSQLDLHKDRTFTFSYSGEIILLPLLDMSKNKAGESFKPDGCTNAKTGMDRPCSKAETDEQKVEWERSRIAKPTMDSELSQAMMGQINLDDPEAGPKLAERLRGQVGWNKVEYIGEGKFDVEFSLSSSLNYDFTFPTIDGFPVASPFVQILAHRDGTVRVNAPGYGPPGPFSPNEAAPSSKPEHSMLDFADGNFIVNTEGEILSHNTQESPAVGQSKMRHLSWKVEPRTSAMPTALIKLP